MSVITEGVENWKQVEFLKSVDSNMVQGFLFDNRSIYPVKGLNDDD